MGELDFNGHLWPRPQRVTKLLDFTLTGSLLVLRRWGCPTKDINDRTRSLTCNLFAAVLVRPGADHAWINFTLEDLIKQTGVFKLPQAMKMLLMPTPCVTNPILKRMLALPLNWCSLGVTARPSLRFGYCTLTHPPRRRLGLAGR